MIPSLTPPRRFWLAHSVRLFVCTLPRIRSGAAIVRFTVISFDGSAQRLRCMLNFLLAIIIDAYGSVKEDIQVQMQLSRRRHATHHMF